MQVGLLVGLASICRLFWFLGLPLTKQVQSIPDDAFYYLVLARNYAESGIWTLDHLSTASGFHPLHAFLLAGLSALDPSASLSLAILVVGTASAVAMAVTAALTARILEDAVGGSAIWAAAALLASPLVLLEVTALMEAPWMLLAGALSYRCVLGSSRSSLFRVGLVGVFGSLARTDFGLLPLMMLIAASVLPLQAAVRRRLQLRLVVLLVGASLSLGLFLIYVHGYSGNWFQSSARIKSLWAEIYGQDIRSYLVLLLVILLSKSVLVFFAVTLLQLTIGVSQRVRMRVLASAPGRGAESAGGSRFAASETTWIGSSGGIAVLAYILFYGLENSAAPQTWYAASFLVPLALAIGIIAGSGLARVNSSPRWRSIMAVALVLGALGSLWDSRHPRFRHQVNVLGAGWWLKENPQDRRVGAFNAGLLAYSSETDVVNLDGLVNDDIFDYVSRNALVEYIDDHDVGYILDYPAMWRMPATRERGGHGDGELMRRLRLESRIAPLEPRFAWLGRHPILMRIENSSATDSPAAPEAFE